MAKFHSKKKIRVKGINIVTIIIVFLLMSIFLLFKYINSMVLPYMLNIGSVKSRQVALYIIKQSIDRNVIEKMNKDDLYEVTNDSDNNISSVDFNMVTVNKILTDINNNIEKKFNLFEEGKLHIKNSGYISNSVSDGIVYNIPMGVVFNNPLLTNIGPKIPVRMIISDCISSNLSSSVTNYGINNAVMKLDIHIEVSIKTILPFVSRNDIVKSDVPLSIKMVKGNVPNYYSTGIKENSPIITSN